MQHYGRIYLRKSMCNFLEIKFNWRKNEVHKIGHLSIEYKLIFINLGYICSYRSIQKSCITIFVSIINQMYQRTGYRTPRHPLDSSYLCMKMEWPGNISHIKLTKYDRLQCTQIQRYIMRMIRAGFGKKHELSDTSLIFETSPWQTKEYHVGLQWIWKLNDYMRKHS